MVKLMLYILIIPLTTWAIDSVDINKIYKKNKDNYLRERVIYMFIIMSISYLEVNFIYDFLKTFN